MHPWVRRGPLTGRIRSGCLARSVLLPSVVANVNTSKTETKLPGINTPESQVLEDGYNDNSWSAQLRQPVLNLSSWFGYSSAKALLPHRLMP